MLAKTKAIVLSRLKYGDFDYIVKCYTQQFGLVSFILKGILKSKKSKLKTAYFQPLSLLQIEVNYKQNRSLQTIRDVRLSYTYNTLQTHIYKASVAVFLTEVLSNVLKEESPNNDLFLYLEASFQYLDTEDIFANFHLLFLLKLTKYLGFYPEKNKMDTPYFNLKSGVFESIQKDKYSISGNNVTLLTNFLGTDFDALSSIKIKATQRKAFLNIVLFYYELHLDGFKTPKSLQVFNDVFR